jgi:two-component system, cell cycle sensor histidine kinase and response regulator CckA
VRETTVTENQIENPSSSQSNLKTGFSSFLRSPATHAVVLVGFAVCAVLVATGTTGGLSIFATVLVGAAFSAGLISLYRSSQGRSLGSVIASAIDNSSEVTFVTTLPLDHEAPFVLTNPAFHRLFAAAPGSPPVASLNDLVRLFGGGEGAIDELARLQATANAGSADHCELSFESASGAREWCRLSVQPFHIPGAKGGYVLWRGRDVTARRELEKVRRREEETFTDFLDNLPAGFFSSDEDGNIIYANNKFVEWLGISAEELSARNMRFSDFVVAASADAAVGVPEKGVSGDVTLRGPGGSLFKACLVQSEHLDDNGRMIYSRSVLLRDLTWRGQTGVQGMPVNASSGNSHKLRWLFDEAPVGIVLLDLQGNVTESNRAFLKLRGIHRESVIGRPFSEQISKEDRGDVAAQLSKVVMGIMPASHLEVRMMAMGERELIASLYASRLEDDSGEVSGLVLHFIDTTEHKNLEVQFAQSQKMQAVGQLAGGVAHDFNNLLTAMIGFSDLLLMRHGPDDPSFSDIQQIKQNANRATNLVRQLLAFSRQQELEPEILDITDALSDLSNLLGRLIGENLELKFNHERDLWLVLVDRGQFDQVIINLAVNARDAMPGGGSVSIRTSNTTLDMPVQRGHEVMKAGDYVLVEVADTGSGIAKENISRIFEPFFSTKEVGAGTGLGLSTVYGIVRQTGGYIFVDSAPGEGTTFTIYLPRLIVEGQSISAGVEQGSKALGDPSQTAATLPSPLVPPSVSGADEKKSDLTGEGTVLLVEDEDAVRMFGARALTNKGYKVLEAGNGEEALDVINNGAGQKIDIIISDVVMPGMNGHTLVQLVRHEIPDIKIILMSGYSEDVFADDVESDSGIEFLAKPFSLKELATKVRDVLEG